MADPLGAAGSIVGIAAFGLKFATTLQTYIEAVADARESLRDITFDVSATASALEQLHEFTKTDENGKAIANDAGVQEVSRLASQCKKVYTAIIDLIAKAVGVPRDDNGEVSLDALDLNRLNVTSLIQKLKWPFKEPRIKKHQEELRWLKISLLFQLRLMELAKTKMMAPARSVDAWEKEAALQATLEKLLSRKEEYARQIAAKRRRRKMEIRKTGKAPVRTFPLFTEEEIHAQGPNSEQKTSTSKPRRSFAGSEESIPLKEDNDVVEAKDISLSERPIDDPLTYTPPKQIPKPPKTKSAPDPIVNDTPGAAIGPSNTPALENIGKRESDTSPLVSPRPVLGPSPRVLAQTFPAPSFPLFNTPADIVNDRVATQTNLADVGNKDNPQSQTPIQSIPAGSSNEKTNPGSQPAKGDEESNPRGHATDFLRKWHYKPRSSRGTFKNLLRLSRLFKKQNRFIHNWKNQELEAYLIESEPNPASTSNSSTNTVRKLPFGHRELIRMLRQITKSRNGDLWTQYTSLSSAQRASVERAIQEAHRSSAHARTCVAITSSSQPHVGNEDYSYIVIFLALGPPVLPIHFKHDTQYFQFPFELCRTWEGMEDLIARSLSDMGNIASEIRQGRYVLKSLDDHTIVPATWSNVVSPGLVVFLVFSPPHGRFGAPLPRLLPPLLSGRASSAERILRRAPSPSPPLRFRRSSRGSPSPPPPPRREMENEWVRRKERASSRTRKRGVESNSDVSLHPSSAASDVSSSYLTEASEPARQWFGGTRSHRRARSRGPVLLEHRGRRGIETSDGSDLEPENAEVDDIDVGDEEVDIIDFEAEQETAQLGLGGLLGKWTNAFDAPTNEQHN
ncbi:hypothetical protein F5Y13DRAFT_197574 [Hypoxylon sp. FL1857]|nr:hypothetical protein F5Y13DRAFT_197574 [Hypoxylon sp. FL1857]